MMRRTEIWNLDPSRWLVTYSESGAPYKVRAFDDADGHEMCEFVNTQTTGRFFQDPRGFAFELQEDAVKFKLKYGQIK